MPKTINIFDLLKQDHKHVKSELRELISVCRKGDEVDFERLTQCRQELELHMRLEEEFLYPKAEQEEEAKEMAIHAYEEHQEVKDLLKDLKKGAETDELADALEQVLETVDHHIRDEEGRFFPTLEKVWNKQTLEDLGQTVSEAKERELAKR